MANIKSQKKRILTNEKARQRNVSVKSELKTALRAVDKAVAAGESEAAVVALRELAERLNVSRSTLRDGLRLLEERGLLVQANGRGSRVAQLGTAAITDPLIEMLARHTEGADDYLEFRAIAEAAAAGRTDSPYAGGAVTLLQGLLGVDDDGSFGPKTEAAVKKVQKHAEIEPTGVVDGPTWVALEKEALEEGRVPEGPGAAVAHERERAKEAKAKKAAEAKKKAEKKAEEKARRAELRAERHTAAVADAS